MLADILKFINDEPPSIKDPIEGCPPHDTNCPMGYMCNIVRSRTCANGECILNKSQVCELDCQLALCNAEDQKVEENRNLFHMAGGKDSSATEPPSVRPENAAVRDQPKRLTYSTETRPLTPSQTPISTSVTTPTTTSQTATLTTLMSPVTENPLTPGLTTTRHTSTTRSTTTIPQESDAVKRTDDQQQPGLGRVAMPEHIVTGQAVSRLNENCIYFRRERIFECQNWKVSTIVSDLRRARDLSFKLPYTIKQAMPDLDLPLHEEWLPLASQIVPAFSQEVVTSHVFTYCINAEFHKFYGTPIKSKTKRQLAAIKSIVKMAASCKIPLTPMRKKLLLAAQRHFFRIITKPRFTGFAHFCIERTQETPTVDPALEIKILGPILAKLVSRAVNRVWAKSDIYLKIVGDADYYGYKLPPALDEAVEKTLDEASQEPNLAYVTSLLVKNIHSEDLRRKTRYSYAPGVPAILPSPQ